MSDKDVQVFREGSSNEPKFPAKFDVVKKAVLQVTDIKSNRNKYYAIELHAAGTKYRVFTHYGRTDDLDSNPDAGIRECRYPINLVHAESLYEKIYKEKTSARKGYQELNLASSRIGSKNSIGQSSGEVDDKTLKKLAAKVIVVKDTTPAISIPAPVQKLVTHLYDEATKTLTKKVNATITANGIETPLGVLTIGQIDKGEKILEEIANSLKKKGDILSDLSGQFYTVIPHKLGRTKLDVIDAVINTNTKVKEKEDTLQLMRDMLNVSGKGANILANPKVEKQYVALGCEITHIDKSNPDFKKIKDYTKKSAGYGGIDIKNLFAVKRLDEHKAFNDKVSNHKLLFHGSGAHNWVGILSRGLMLPKMVTKYGVHRTDDGWLGHGIYFGDSIDTALNYASSGKLDSTFVAIAKVALGKIKVYKNITHGITAPPKGFNSCHGNPDLNYSEFDDHEFVIYDTKQQRLEYLLELDG